jgi:D-alanyl-D-alanine carboxypeptidase/D-alanyl-D-alanine-endopeptidase (penicillin-binding protein 4)
LRKILSDSFMRPLIHLGKPFGILLLFLQLIAPVKAAEPLCVADLPAAIDQVRNQEEWARSRFGIVVETLDGDQTLYSHNAQQYFIPASSTKLLTTAAALVQLGTDYRIRTPVYITGKAPVVDRLRLVGKGDPSLTTADLDNLAQELKAQGIQQINELVIEDAYFPPPAIVPSWEWEDVHAYYGVGVNSAILNENAFVLTLLPQNVGEPVQLIWNDFLAAVQWRFENTAITASPETPYGVTLTGELGEPVFKITGELAADAGEDVWGLAVRDPGRYFLETLRLSLLRQGISVMRGTVTTTQQPPTTAFTVVESPPLVDLVTKTNLESNNLYAEALLRTLGKEANEIAGTKAREAVLTALGVNPNSHDLEDGSGLSRHNLMSPNTLVQTLQGIAASPVGDIFRGTLPVAGESGTLQGRFQGTAATGRVQAKTGTMTGVSALSGYVDPVAFDPLVFSILLNQSEQSGSRQQEALDEIVNLLVQVKMCE